MPNGDFDVFAKSRLIEAGRRNDLTTTMAADGVIAQHFAKLAGPEFCGPPHADSPSKGGIRFSYVTRTVPGSPYGYSRIQYGLQVGVWRTRAWSPPGVCRIVMSLSNGRKPAVVTSNLL